MAEETNRVIAVYRPAEGYALPADFKVSAYPGLERIQVTREAGQCRIVTIWQKSTGVVDSANRLGQAGLGNYEWLQTVTDDRPAEKPSWRRRLFSTQAVLGFIAVLGTVETLRNHHAVLFAPPEFKVHPVNASIDVLADSPAKVDFEVRNVAFSGDCRTRLTDATVITADGKAVPLMAQQDDATAYWSDAFSPGKNQVESVALPALPAGKHQLNLKHEGKAGFFWWSKTVPTTAELRAWKRWDRYPTQVHADGDRCDLWFELHIGDAYDSGADLSLVLQPADGLEIKTGDFPGLAEVEVVQLPPAGSGTSAVSKLEFHLPKLKAFTVHRFWIRIAGAKRPEAEWQKIYERILPHMTLEPHPHD